MNRHQILILFIIIVSGLILPGNGFSESKTHFDLTRGIEFDHLATDQGVASETINWIIQDSRGFIWIATSNGLNRYDGNRFLNYTAIPDDSTAISDNFIWTIYEDEEGVLWIGTSLGLNRFNRHTETFTHYLPPRGQIVKAIFPTGDGGLWVGAYEGGVSRFDPATSRFDTFLNQARGDTLNQSKDVQSLWVDANHYLWIGTANDGLFRYNSSTKELKQFTAEAGYLSDNRVETIFEDRRGHIWIGTEKSDIRKQGGLTILDPQTDEIQILRHEPGNSNSLSEDRVLSILEDEHGLMWIGTKGGLNCYDPVTKKYHHFKHDNTRPTTISNDEVRHIFQDRSGLIWVSTNNGGINTFNRRTQKFLTYSHEPSNPRSLSENNVRAIFEDHAGYVWIGTINQGGLNRLDRTTGEFTHFKNDPKDPLTVCDNDISAIFEDTDHTLWIGTWNNGLSRFDPETEHFFAHYNAAQGLVSSSIQSIYRDSRERLWVGTQEGIQRYNPETDYFDNVILDLSNQSKSIYEDKVGNLWFGAWDGLYRFDPGQQSSGAVWKKDQLTRFLEGGHVQSILEDSGGDFWIATYGSGLIRLSFDAGNVSRKVQYTTGNGLVSNSLYGLLREDSGEYLWLSTSDGLSRFNIRSETFHNYNVNDGLQGNQFFWGAYFKNARGELFFGGTRGFNIFHPDQIMMNTHVPPVVITSFKIFQKEVQLDRSITERDSIELTYRENFFTFEFAALDFNNPKKNQYKYRLEGFDPDWIEIGNRNFADYTKVAGGKYRFMVKGSNNDGVWNDNGASLIVVVHPPIWKTKWAYALYILTTIGIIITIILTQRRRIKHQMEFKRKSDELRLARDIQLSLIPKHAPVEKNIEIFGAMQTAVEVGGDYYDFIPSLDGKKVYIAIGDVSGKGAGASMLMVEVRAIFHSLTSADLSTQEILIRTNRLLYPDLAEVSTPMFITMMFMCWDTQQKKMYYTGAGHEKILVYRPQKGKCETIKSGGVCLGIVDNIEFVMEEKLLDFEPGDVIMLYTDGITEYRNPGDDMFGLPRLIDFLERHGELPPPEIINRLMQTLEQFGEGAKQFDDVTVVVIRRR